MTQNIVFYWMKSRWAQRERMKQKLKFVSLFSS